MRKISEEKINPETKFDVDRFKQVFKRAQVETGVDLWRNNCWNSGKLFGYSKSQIKDIIESPRYFCKDLIYICNQFYLNSGYFQRMLNYYAQAARCNWVFNLETFDLADQSKNDKIQTNYFKSLKHIENLKLDKEINRIMKDIWLNDACFAYIVENDADTYLYYFDPKECIINKNVNGVYGFAIDPNQVYISGNYLLSNGSLDYEKILRKYPPEIRTLIKNAWLQEDKIPTEPIDVPIEKTLCIKYHDHIPYLFPPLFKLIKNILLIDDYRDLAIVATESDAYRFMVMQIPLIKDDQELALDYDIISLFVETAKDILPSNIGVVPTPMETTATQFASDNSDRNKVEDAISDMYTEAGISQALLSGATTGSELAMSIIVDAGEVFELYRKMEKSVNLYLSAKGSTSNNLYRFSFEMLDITSFNEDDFINTQLSLAQAALPVKMRLCAAIGMTPAQVFGANTLENDIFGDIFDNWKPLRSSYTFSEETNANSPSDGAKSDDNGRPENEADETTESAQKSRDNDSNNSDNRA